MRFEDRSVQESVRTVNDAVRAYLMKSKAIIDTAMEKELRGALGTVAVDGTLVGGLNEGKKIRGCLTCLVGKLWALPRSPFYPEP